MGLDEAINAIHVRFGEQALGRASAVPPPEPWPTGIEAIDRLSGLGGLPKGRISVLQGPLGSGKLSLALGLLAAATRQLAQAIVIDPWRRFDPWALLPFQPELSALTLARPPDAGSAAEATIALARAGAPFQLVFLWDGGGASANWLGALEAAVQRSGVVLAWVSETLPPPLAHASSFTLRLERTDWLCEHGRLVGLTTEAGCVKNRVSAVAGLTSSVTETLLEIRYPLGVELFPDVALQEAPSSLLGEEARERFSARENTARTWARSAVG